MTINIKGRDLHVNIQSLCSQEEVDQAASIIAREMPAWSDLIPEDHFWFKKILYGFETSEIAKNLLVPFGLTDDCLQRIFTFVADYHNIGHVINFAFNQGEGFKTPFKLSLFMARANGGHHGEWSVELFRAWGVDRVFKHPDVWALIEYACQHHNDVVTPLLPHHPRNLEKIQYIVTALLRDIDKLEFFEDKTTLILHDRREKQLQTEIMKGIVELGPEAGHVSSEALHAFYTAAHEGQSFDARLCQTYEDFVLCFLSWVFDINTHYVFNRIDDGGRIVDISEYFYGRVPYDQWMQIQGVLEAHISNHRKRF